MNTAESKLAQGMIQNGKTLRKKGLIHCLLFTVDCLLLYGTV